MADIKLTINGKVCTAPAGSTILQAADLNHIHIPRLCYLEGIHQYGACRICVVEQVSPPARNLQAACMVEARDGMVIETNTERVREARPFARQWGPRARRCAFAQLRARLGA